MTLPAAALPWDRPHPFLLEIMVDASHMDRLGHTNNTHYVHWMQTISWQHVETIGMGWSLQQTEGRAMAIIRTEIDYIASAYTNDHLFMGTWITECDDRLQSARQFQLIRVADQKTLLRATCRYVCIDIKKGKPMRMPASFIQAHHQAISMHLTTN